MSDLVRPIQWYPGHMAKARRLLKEQISRVDLVVEVCDARIPMSSRNPDLVSLAGKKPHLLMLNKADLADPAVSSRWIAFFRREGIVPYLTRFSGMRSKEVLSMIERATREHVERAMEKGIRKTVRVMIVGIPNVGKSTMINLLNGKGVTRTGDRPGVTKANQWVRITPYLELLDTPGLLWPRFDDQDAARKLCYIGSLKDDVLDLYDLTVRLLEDLCVLAPDQVASRFRLRDSSLRGTELLDAVCAGRGWLLKGNQYDYDRCCSVVLDEFRAGKVGRFTLEKPEDYMQGENKHERPDGTCDHADGI